MASGNSSTARPPSGFYRTNSRLFIFIRTQIFSYEALLSAASLLFPLYEPVSLVKRGPQLPPAVRSQNGKAPARFQKIKIFVQITESQNVGGWQGPLWITQSNPLLKQGHPERAAQDRVQAGLEYLQRRRLHNLPGLPVPGLRHPQREEVLETLFYFSPTPLCPHGTFSQMLEQDGEALCSDAFERAELLKVSGALILKLYFFT